MVFVFRLYKLFNLNDDVFRGFDLFSYWNFALADPGNKILNLKLTIEKAVISIFYKIIYLSVEIHNSSWFLQFFFIFSFSKGQYQDIWIEVQKDFKFSILSLMIR